MGNALIQEYRFNQYCERLQRLIMEKINDEFKMFLRWRGFNIDSGLFDIKFNPPQNFAAYRQTELDQARIQSFTQLEQVPYLSKRFMLKRFLGLSDLEIAENEELWNEEKGTADDTEVSGQDLRSVGVLPGDLDADIETGEALAQPGMPGLEPGAVGPGAAEAATIGTPGAPPTPASPPPAA